MRNNKKVLCLALFTFCLLLDTISAKIDNGSSSSSSHHSSSLESHGSPSPSSHGSPSPSSHGSPSPSSYESPESSACETTTHESIDYGSSSTTTESSTSTIYSQTYLPAIPTFSIADIKTYTLGLRSDGYCKITVDVDFTDHDKYLNDGSQTIRDIDQECCVLCQDTEGCVSWVYYNNDENNSDNKKGECWLSSAYTDGINCNLCSSTYFDELEDTLSDVYQNIAFETEYGLLNNPSKDTVKSSDECIKLCEETDSCVAWTYIKNDDRASGAKKGECYLRSFAPYFIYAPYADSGISLAMKMQMCQEEKNTCMDSDYGYVNGPDYDITDSNEECAYLCQMELSCRSWVRVHKKNDDYEIGTCILRDWVPLTEPCDYADCGKDGGYGPTEHVILIIADDLGIDHLGIYKDSIGEDARDEYPYTPNIDFLARKSIKFNYAYSNPTCSPSRSTIMSGKYGFRTGIGYPIGAICQDGLDGNTTTLPTLLPYSTSTGAIGKWHISSFGADLDIPRKMGFDRFEGFIDGTIFDYYDWEKTINGEPVVSTYEYCTTDMVNAVQKFFDTMEYEKWFLWMAFNAPHTPFHKPPDDLHYHADLLDVDPLEYDLDPIPYFHAMIEALDTEIGRIWDYIPEEKQERTTIIFMGDNGSPKEVSDGQPFDEFHCKEKLAEGGIRIPFTIGNAGVRNGGRECNDLVNVVDLFTTIIELFGAEVPKDFVTDGVSLIPVMRDEDYNRRTFAYSEAFGPNRTCDNPDNGFIYDYGQVIRNYKYKLWCPIYYDDETGEEMTGIQEMYNMEVDPWEEDNLFDENGYVRDDLDKSYQNDITNNRIELEAKIDEFNEDKIIEDKSIVGLSVPGTDPIDIWETVIDYDAKIDPDDFPDYSKFIT